RLMRVPSGVRHPERSEGSRPGDARAEILRSAQDDGPRSELGTLLEAAFRTRPPAAWLADLAAAGIPAAPVPLDFRGAFFTDPHAAFHGYAVRYQHPDLGA